MCSPSNIHNLTVDLLAFLAAASVLRTSFSTRHKACPVPYCERHLKSGDDALKVYQHPKGFGKILVARFNLPKGYRMVYHGLRQTTGHSCDIFHFFFQQIFFVNPWGRLGLGLWDSYDTTSTYGTNQYIKHIWDM